MMNMIYAIDGWQFLWWSYGVPCPVFTFFGCFGLLEFQENFEFLFKKLIFLKLFDWFEFSSKSDSVKNLSCLTLQANFGPFSGQSSRSSWHQKVFFLVFAGVSNKFYFFTLKSPSSGVFFFLISKGTKISPAFFDFWTFVKNGGATVLPLWNFLIYILAICASLIELPHIHPGNLKITPKNS